MRHDDSLGSASHEAERYKGSSKGLPCSLNPISFSAGMATLPILPTSSLRLASQPTHFNASPTARCRLNTVSSPSPTQQPPIPRCVWQCIHPSLLWANLSLGLLGLSPYHPVTHCPPLHPTSLAHTTHSSSPPSHHSNAPFHSPRRTMSPSLPSLLPSQDCPQIPIPHPAITVPMRYSSNRQKVPRFCGAIVPLCRPRTPALLTAPAAPASARQPTRP